MAALKQLLYIIFASLLGGCTCSANNFVGNNNFPLKALQTKPDENVVISPLSISVAVGMLYLGSKGESKTQIKQALFSHASDTELLGLAENLKDLFNARSSAYNITLANRLYTRRNYPLLDSYTSLLRAKFNSDIMPVEFNDETVRQINKWVAEKTNEKIKDLLKPGSLPPNTAAVLVNALHMKAEWAQKFSAGNTRSHIFYSISAKNVTVDMMHMYREDFYYKENSDVQVLGIPFAKKADGGPELIMYIVLPKERFGLKRFESSLNNLDQLNAIFRESQITELAQIDIPKFKLEFELELIEALKSLGIRNIFQPGAADLSGINDHRDLYVSDAAHKAVIEVTESGIEAAAATFMNSVIVSEFTEIDFIADHPFLFAIIDKRSNYTPLFLGRFVGK